MKRQKIEAMHARKKLELELDALNSPCHLVNGTPLSDRGSNYFLQWSNLGVAKISTEMRFILCRSC